MIQQLKDKINLESIKSSVQDQVTSAATGLASSALSQARAFANAQLSALLAPALSIITNVTGLISSAVSFAKRAVSFVISKTAGDPKNILDPAKDQLLSVLPALPSLPTTLPDLGPISSQIGSSVLTQINSLTPEAANQIINSLEKISKLIQQQANNPVTLVDNTSDISAGLPDLNEDIPTNNRGFANTKAIKGAMQAASPEQRISVFNNLVGTTPGEKISIREKLIALQQSSDVYRQGINSNYVKPVSDQVGLLTLGHTIDTPALDPEDWGDIINLNSGDRLVYRPPELYPTTSKNKIRPEIAALNQSFYQQVNQKMYYNLYRDRYNNRSFVASDYNVARYTEGSLYGFKILAVSNNNLGDYASIGFSKINNSPQQEINNLQINSELLSLVGYLNNLYNVNSIDEKPIYEISIQGTTILIDTRGNRFLLPASKPDETPVRVT